LLGSEAAVGGAEHALGAAEAKAGWWAKTVQLDLEAKGTIARAKAKPLRLHKTCVSHTLNEAMRWFGASTTRKF
jgi:Family of unknown function (DUF6958)